MYSCYHFRLVLSGWFLAVFGIIAASAVPVLDDRPLTQYRERQWKYEEDLPISRITDVHVSQSGFLWLASYDGLFRYDMARFRRYTQEDCKGLAGGCAAIHEDRQGTLWIGGNGGGLTRFQNGIFTSWSVEDGLDFSVYRRLFAGPEGQIMFPGKTGLQTIENEKVVQYAFPGISDLAIREIVFSGPDQLYVGLWSGELLKISRNPATPGAYAETMNVPMVQGKMVRALACGPDGTLWVGYSNGVLVRIRPDGETRAFDPPEPYADTTWHLETDDRGTLWGGCRHGLVRVYGETYASMPMDSDYQQNMVVDVAFTPDGALYASAYASGLHSFSIPKLKFITARDGLPNGAVSGVVQAPDGKIWMGSDRGIFVIDPVTLRPVSFKPELFEQYQIRDLFFDMNHQLWICAAGGFLMRMNPADGSSRIWNAETGLPSNRVRLIQQVSDETFWLATQDGLVHLLKDDEWVAYQDLDGIPSNYFLSIYEDSRKRLWFGTAGGGLVLFENGGFRQVTRETEAEAGVVFQVTEHDSGQILASWVGGLIAVDSDDTSKIRLLNVGKTESDTVIFGVLKDSRGDYWLPSSGAIKRIRHEDFDNFLRSEGKTGVDYKNFDWKNALPTRSVRANARACLDREGQLWIPLGEGTSIVDPKSISENDYPPMVSIESAEIDHSELHEFYGNEPRTLRMEPGRKSIRIAYSGISHQGQETLKFRYRLNGFEDWVETERMEASYTNLKPRDYVFEVLAGNGDDAWTKAPVKLHLTVEPSFYQHPLFILGCGLLGMLLLWILYRWRVLALRHQSHQLELVVKERTHELAGRNELLKTSNMKLTDTGRDLAATVSALKSVNENINHLLGTTAHDLRNSIGAIVSSAELLKTSIEDSKRGDVRALEESELLIKLISNTGEGLLSKIHQLLETDVRSLGEIHFEPEFRVVAEIIQAVVELNRATARLKDQTLVVHHLSQTIAKVDPLSIRTAIDNYVSNAIKYSPYGTVITLNLEELTLEDDSRWLRFSVKDEGPGLSLEDQQRAFTRFTRLSSKPTGNEYSSGVGLSIVKAVIKAHRGEVGVISELGHGAEFFFVIPL